MKKTVSLILAALMILVACLTTSCGKEIPKIASDPKYVIGICEAAEHTALSSATKGFMDALTEELGEDYVEFNIIDVDTMEYRETVMINSQLILEAVFGGSDISRIIAEISSMLAQGD